MKKTVPVAVAAIPATIRDTIKYFCDIKDCTEVSIMRYGGKTPLECCLCKRDICKRHMVDDDYHGGDYYDYYCTICAGLFLRARRLLDEKHNEEYEALEKKCIEESLAHG